MDSNKKSKGKGKGKDKNKYKCKCKDKCKSKDKCKKCIMKLLNKLDKVTAMLEELTSQKLISDVLNNNFFHPHNLVIPLNLQSSGTITSLSTKSSSTYYEPKQIITAYGVDKIITPDNKPRGYGIKIAVISAYHYANLQNDLNKYCNKYSLIPITLSIINQAGATTNANWAIGGCISTQIINVIAPGATTYVIEAKDNSVSSMTTAIKTAENLGCSIIHMGFGCDEFSTEMSIDTYFSNTSISYIASAIGSSNTVSYPSASPNICSVGGTTLTLNTDFSRFDETTWDNAGNGPSKYQPKPSYQKNISNIIDDKRVTPDVAFVASSSTGVVIYSGGTYYSASGTIVSASIFTGFVAIANQLRKSKSKPMLTTVASSTKNQLQNYMYQVIYANNPNNTNYKQAFFDVIEGSDGINNAGPGYDYCTGLGSGNADSLCVQLVNA